MTPAAYEVWLDALAEEALPSRPVWRRSRAGNLTRCLRGQHLTVFQHRGRWKWSVTDANTDEVRYSPHGYPTEDAALDAVLAAVRGG